MPELIEVEYYADALREAVGTPLLGVSTLDELVGGGIDAAAGVVSALTGVTITGVRRIGKVLFADISTGSCVWMRFGMTGRLIVGDNDPVPLLEYGPTSDDWKWDRMVIEMADGAAVRLNDARRLARVGVGHNVGALGPDAATLDASALASALSGRRALKAVLLDQKRVAGLGNLLVDESLWRAGLDPSRRADSLDADEIRQLSETITGVIDDLSQRGGSHRGDLQDARGGGPCPRDGAALERRVVAGRTTWSCPAHQR